MLDLDTRTAILALHREGHSIRQIAEALSVSRNAVKRVLASGQTEVPKFERIEALGEHLERIRELYVTCKGNVVRVCELLAEANTEVGYSTLTAFCRRHGIGQKPKQPVGRYHFVPGEEMQHDTSPHTVEVGGKMTRLECASLVLCYSRMMFMQAYRRFSRFECRAFLSEGIQYFGGAAERCMVDNTSVVRIRGTGKDMVPAPVMAAFSERFGFGFVAHELGDANRSARVERNFDFVERNFYPGRSFADLADLNRQLKDWCDTKNRSVRKLHGEIKAVPMELFATERLALSPLPIHIPEVYDLHSRRVDVEGYVTLHRNRYTVPVLLIGRRLEVRESLERVRFFDGHKLVAEHQRIEPGACRRSTLPEHRVGPRPKKKPSPPSPEEETLRAAAPELAELVAHLRKRHGGQALRAVRRLHRFYLDYPTQYLAEAARTALEYGLIDLGRIERMTLQRIRGDFFRLPPSNPDALGDEEPPEKDDDPGGDPEPEPEE